MDIIKELYNAALWDNVLKEKPYESKSIEERNVSGLCVPLDLEQETSPRNKQINDLATKLFLQREKPSQIAWNKWENRLGKKWRIISSLGLSYLFKKAIQKHTFKKTEKLILDFFETHKDKNASEWIYDEKSNLYYQFITEEREINGNTQNVLKRIEFIKGDKIETTPNRPNMLSHEEKPSTKKSEKRNQSKIGQKEEKSSIKNTISYSSGTTVKAETSRINENEEEKSNHRYALKVAIRYYIEDQFDGYPYKQSDFESLIETISSKALDEIEKNEHLYVDLGWKGYNHFHMKLAKKWAERSYLEGEKSTSLNGKIDEHKKRFENFILTLSSKHPLKEYLSSEDSLDPKFLKSLSFYEKGEVAKEYWKKVKDNSLNIRLSKAIEELFNTSIENFVLRRAKRETRTLIKSEIQNNQLPMIAEDTQIIIINNLFSTPLKVKEYFQEDFTLTLDSTGSSKLLKELEKEFTKAPEIEEEQLEKARKMEENEDIKKLQESIEEKSNLLPKSFRRNVKAILDKNTLNTVYNNIIILLDRKIVLSHKGTNSSLAIIDNQKELFETHFGNKYIPFFSSNKPLSEKEADELLLLTGHLETLLSSFNNHALDKSLSIQDKQAIIDHIITRYKERKNAFHTLQDYKVDWFKTLYRNMVVLARIREVHEEKLYEPTNVSTMKKFLKKSLDKNPIEKPKKITKEMLQSTYNEVAKYQIKEIKPLSSNTKCRGVILGIEDISQRIEEDSFLEDITRLSNGYPRWNPPIAEEEASPSILKSIKLPNPQEMISKYVDNRVRTSWGNKTEENIKS